MRNHSWLTSIIVLLTYLLILQVTVGLSQEFGNQGVSELIIKLKDKNKYTRSAAADELAEKGPTAAPAIPDLINLLHDKDLFVRSSAADALGKIGIAALPALRLALRDQSPDVRSSAASAIADIGLAAVDTTPDLMKVLRYKDSIGRQNAAKALAKMGVVAVPDLIRALQDKDVEIRATAVGTLGEIGPSAVSAVPSLIKALRDESEWVRGNAHDALGKIGEVALPEIRRAAQDPDAIVRIHIADVWGQFGLKALPDIKHALEDEEAEVRRRAVAQLEKLGPAAVPELTKALQDDGEEVRSAAAYFLSQVGPTAVTAVPQLILSLKDEDHNVREHAADTLGSLGSAAAEAVPALMKILQDRKEPVRRSAAEALSKMGSAALVAVPELIAILSDKKSGAQDLAANALGNLGIHARPALPALIEALKEENTRQSSAKALSRIALSLQDNDDWDSLDLLEAADEILTATSNPKLAETTATLERTINYLKLKEQNSWVKIVRRNLYVILGLSIYGFLFLLCLILLLAKPLWLLRINNFLILEVKVKANPVEITLPLRYALLVGFLYHHPRVLDAWVAKYITQAKENFLGKATVEQRKVYVDVQVSSDNSPSEIFTAKQLQPAFKKQRVCLLITGEGGSGKTSLACQMAQWAYSEDTRLCEDHLMLPVLIEQDLDLPIKETQNILLETIKGQLTALVSESEPMPDDLLIQLLRKRRILVIVDGFSELSEDTRKRIRPGHPDFPAAALIVTSRQGEVLDGVPKTVIKIARIQGNRISSFMDAYLKQCGKRELFDDQEYFEACGRLSTIAGEGEITALIAKLYAEQMIISKEGRPDLELPKNIPDLMLSYLNELNRGARFDDPEDRTVHRVAKTVAWECLRQNYRPTPAKRTQVLLALASEENPASVITYLESRLRLIQTIGVERDQVRFSLDPLAEYLAGLHILDDCADYDDRWQEFLQQGTKQESAPTAIKGFLLAVRDCCLTRGTDKRVPEYIPDELARIAGLDPEVIKAAQLTQRVGRLSANLSVPEAEDRLASAQALARIGPDAKAALPKLIQSINDESGDVRQSAVIAIGKVGFADESTVGVLIKCLKHFDHSVRSSAASMLGNWGSKAKTAIPSLIKASSDSDDLVRQEAASALGKIAAPASDSVSALIVALGDENNSVRIAAAHALKRFGPHAEIAVPELLNTLSSKDKEVRHSIIEALIEIGPKAKAAISNLLHVVENEDETLDNRWHAIIALGRIKQQASRVVPVLTSIINNNIYYYTLGPVAAASLGEFGAEASDAVPYLKERSENSEITAPFSIKDIIHRHQTGKYPKKPKNSATLKVAAKEALKRILCEESGPLE